jgi:hypothetical protein
MCRNNDAAFKSEEVENIELNFEDVQRICICTVVSDEQAAVSV